MHPLRATIPDARMARYDSACEGTGVDAIDLYRWNSAVALALFDDLATVEVAMRSAMARELSSAFGVEWYRRGDLLDDEAIRLVDDAWRRSRLGLLESSPEVIHGKLVATLMFGFWVKLLGRGGYQGAGEHRRRRIYDSVLWKPALRRAFPNAGDLDRSLVETAARRVQALRNRIAHHEHTIWGIPLSGERRPDGSVERLGVGEAHNTLLALAEFVDVGLAGRLRENSRVGEQLARCPVADASRFLL